jgi:hypothetical protein
MNGKDAECDLSAVESNHFTAKARLTYLILRCLSGGVGNRRA